MCPVRELAILDPGLAVRKYADAKEDACTVNREVLLRWSLLLMVLGSEELAAARERRKGV